MSESKKNKEPWNDVTNPIYFYNVLAQMINIDPDATLNKSLSVRFGLMGEHDTPDPHAHAGDHRFGARPNYQVELVGHRPCPIKSVANKLNAHQRDERGSYEESHLSDRRFEFKEVVELLKTCIERAERNR
jgi:hypothetical protein